MKLSDHIARTAAFLQQTYPEFVAQEDPDVLALLNSEIHRWFDIFSEKPWPEIYGYIDIDCMKHREQRHHIQGLNACVYVFTRFYGSKYKTIIRSIAKMHLHDDWGEITEMGDFNSRFWKIKRGY